MNKSQLVLLLLFTLALHQTNAQNIDSLFVLLSKKIQTDKAYNIKNNDSTKVAIIDKIFNNKLNVEPDSTKQLLHKIKEIGEKNNDSIVLAKIHLIIGKKYLYNRYNTVANQYLDSVLLFLNTANSGVNLSILSEYYLIKGNYYFIENNRNKALHYYQKSLYIAIKINKPKIIIKAQNNITAILFSQKKYKKALLLFKKNIIQAKKSNDIKIKNITLYNISYTYKKIKNKDSANHYINLLIHDLKKNKKLNKVLLANSYKLKGLLFMDDNKSDKGFYWLKKATQIDNNNSDLWVYLGYYHFIYQNYKKAEEKYFQAIKLLKKQNNQVLLSDIYDSISKLYQKQHKYKLSNNFLIASNKITDSIYITNNNDKINELRKKELIDIKDIKLKDQKDVLNQQSIKSFRKNIIIGTITGLLTLLIIAIYYYLKRQKEQQAIGLMNRLQEERERVALDLHDNLGAHLSFIISSIDNILFTKEISKEMLVAKIKNVKEFASETTSLFRDTTWALNKDVFTVADFINRFKIYINRVQKSNPGVKVFFVNQINTNIIINPIESLNIFRILQEAINNSVKYSKINKTAVFFEEDENYYIFKIIDHGIGFDQENVTMGYGLKNMKRRIADLNGKIVINSKNGTEIIIHLPK